MTLKEFTAWLDGFSDAMGDAPTPEQWAKIKAKLSQVSEGLDLRGLSGSARPARPYYPAQVVYPRTFMDGPDLKYINNPNGVTVCGTPAPKGT